jgi:hypothetical protein
MSFSLSGTFEVRKKSERRKRSIEIELKYKQTVFYIDKEKKEIKLSYRLKQTINCNQILRNKAVPT